MSKFTIEELNQVAELIANAIEFYASDPYSNPKMRDEIRQLYSDKYYALFHSSIKLLDWCKRALVINEDRRCLTGLELNDLQALIYSFEDINWRSEFDNEPD